MSCENGNKMIVEVQTNKISLIYKQKSYYVFASMEFHKTVCAWLYVAF